MASQSVGNSESIAAFIPDLELLITEAMDEWKVPGLAMERRRPTRGGVRVENLLRSRRGAVGTRKPLISCGPRP
jgi:hypothetical protein